LTEARELTTWSTTITVRPCASATGLGRGRHKEERSISRLNGRPSVTLVVKRQADANTVEVIKAIKEAARHPGATAEDVRFEVVEDQSRYIYEALHEINVHLAARQHSRQPRGVCLHEAGARR
jgi:multidrug efflux pump subunit AcrB